MNRYMAICGECGRQYKYESTSPTQAPQSEWNCGNTGCEDRRAFRDNGIPGVYVKVASSNMTIPPEFDNSDLDAIMNNITVVSGNPINLNTMMNLARSVAEFYELDDVVKDIDTFFNWKAGSPITVKTGVLFWMTVFRRLKK